MHILLYVYLNVHKHAHVASYMGRDRPIMLIFYLLCYAAVLIKFTYYTQNYAQEIVLSLLSLLNLYTNLHE